MGRVGAGRRAAREERREGQQWLGPAKRGSGGDRGSVHTAQERGFGGLPKTPSGHGTLAYIIRSTVPATLAASPRTVGRAPTASRRMHFPTALALHTAHCVLAAVECALLGPRRGHLRHAGYGCGHVRGAQSGARLSAPRWKHHVGIVTTPYRSSTAAAATGA
ncbi:hypothetical protein BDU57DRAFT_294018 [Ampelomyces quisqualis]|uniref:Uncharacterized protein n=1 Tax=Ampelomyces quisqualis TaxID=50730 RepID=A0A6A5QHW1_AMPQU|nr:hypothetical protein BDU57DRAFT_294018 [Ampelomyces quisqualis]